MRGDFNWIGGGFSLGLLALGFVGSCILLFLFHDLALDRCHQTYCLGAIGCFRATYDRDSVCGCTQYSGFNSDLRTNISELLAGMGDSCMCMLCYCCSYNRCVRAVVRARGIQVFSFVWSKTYQKEKKYVKLCCFM